MSLQTLLSDLFRHKAWADEQLLGALLTMDQKAHANERLAALRTLSHIHTVDRIFAAHLQRRHHAYASTRTSEASILQDLETDIAESDQWYVDYVGRVTQDELAERIAFTFTDGKPGRMTREEMLVHVIAHGAYHRGEVGRIFTELSLTRPRDVFTGFLHIIEPERREAR
jgi:uncharacterized damage-inducible protein DinB